jgi:hypothetical protein
MREANRERMSNFVIGASIPGVVIVPIEGYLIAKGNYQTAVDAIKCAAPIMAAWGLYGISEFKGTYVDRQRRKDVRRGARRSIKEVIFDKMPTPPLDVSSYLKTTYQSFEMSFEDNKENNKFNPLKISEDLAVIIKEDLLDVVMNGRDLPARLKGDKKSEYITKTDAIIHLIQFGWQVREQHMKGLVHELEEDVPYSEFLVSESVANWVSDHFIINNKGELSQMLEVLSVPAYLRD